MATLVVKMGKGQMAVVGKFIQSLIKGLYLLMISIDMAILLVQICRIGLIWSWRQAIKVLLSIFTQIILK